MKELFRKHGKYIMGVLSIALMFVFALPTFRNPTPSDRLFQQIGTVNGKKVTNNDTTIASNELAQLRMFFTDQYSLYFPQSDYNKIWIVIQTQQPDPNLQPLYWHLLKVDARKYGASIFSEDDARTFVAEWQLQPYVGRDPNMKSLAALFADLDTVRNYLNFVSTPPRPVTSLELLADKVLRKLQVSYALLDGQKDWEQIPDPTAAQLEAQFAAYKGVLPTPVLGGYMPGVLPPADKDGHHFPFGYKYPDRAVVEYVAFDRAAIKARIKADLQKTMDDALKARDAARAPVIEKLKANPDYVAAVKKESDARAALDAAKTSNAASEVLAAKAKDVADAHLAVSKMELPALSRDAAYANAQANLLVALAPESEALKYYQEHPERYRKTASALDIASTQTSQPSVLPWEEVKEKVIDSQFVEPRVSQQMKRMTDLFFDRAGKTPKPDYAALLKELKTTSEFGGYEPKLATTGPGLLGAAQLSKIPGIGSASYYLDSAKVEALLAQPDPSKPSLAISVDELVTLDQQNTLYSLREKLKTGVEGPLLTDNLRNNYIYRVTAAEKSREPASVDADPEVRRQVVEDFKKLENFKKRQQQMKDLARAAENVDLEPLATQQKLPVGKPAEFSQLTPRAFEVVAQHVSDYDRYMARMTPEILEFYASNIEQDKKQIDDEKTRLGFDQLKDPMKIRDFIPTAFTLANRIGAATQPTRGAIELQDESSLTCCVIQLAKVTPATGADFGSARASLFRSFQDDVGKIDPQVGVTGKFLTNYLSPASLEARVKWIKKP